MQKFVGMPGPLQKAFFGTDPDIHDINRYHYDYDIHILIDLIARCYS